MERKTQQVLGYDVDLMSFSEAVNFVEKNLSDNKGLYIVTINPEIIEYSNKNKEFKKLLQSADLTVPDGVGIKIALKLKGTKQETIPGVDLAYKLLSSATNLKKSVALVGAKEEVINKAKDKLLNDLKDLDICYSHNGYFGENEDLIIENLISANPSLVLVALGAPKQDLFINKCKEKLPNSTFIGIGGSFDVWAGYVERAPEIYRKLGLEWLYRTVKQPERLKRIYKTLPLFLFKAIIDAVKYRWDMCLKGRK